MNFDQTLTDRKHDFSLLKSTEIILSILNHKDNLAWFEIIEKKKVGKYHKRFEEVKNTLKSTCRGVWEAGREEPIRI